MRKVILSMALAAVCVFAADPSGKWTWEEFYPAYHASIQMMDSVDHKVNFIMDLLQSQHIPPGALHHIKRAADFNHPNMGLAVYVGINPLIQAMGRLFRKLYPASAQYYPFDFARTIEDAEFKIARLYIESK